MAKSQKPKIVNEEFFKAIAMLEEEKKIPADFLLEKVCSAIVTSLRKDYGGEDIVFVECKPEEKILRVYIRKKVVEVKEREDSFGEILLEEAKKYKKNVLVGDFVEIDLGTDKLGYIAATTTKNILRGEIRSAERDIVLREFRKKEKEIVSGVVQSVDPQTGCAIIKIGETTVTLPESQQIPGEVLVEGKAVQVYIEEIIEADKAKDGDSAKGGKKGRRGSRVRISRTSPGFVKRLFEKEVPEIADGIVIIKEIVRDAGSRTKMAVFSNDENVDPVGACIGNKGARVNQIVEILNGEKIDIIVYDEDPAKYIAAALAPATVLEVELETLEDGKRACHVTVPDTQLSLAIGNGGQNARLAARLTNWKIDIKPESGFYIPQNS